jgi:DNA-binding response OmpR family regulator
MISRPTSVLLIEDNPGDAVLIRRLLSQDIHGQFQVRWVDSLTKGMEILLGEGENVDVVLLDLNLPDSQGLRSFSRVYAEAPNMPVILLTGRYRQ